ncbi:MAG: thiosulfate oxidation carrier protein SoxY [Methyloprofundus sp.]|nr:thiosulfate oxidation carrier protein SoxY [Methyloprofundus sp.]
MRFTRRDFIQKFVVFAGSLALPKLSLANWFADDFSHRSINATLAALFPEQQIQSSRKIFLKLPRIAENGSVVPITITSSIKYIDTVYILSEKNPVPLIAKFSLAPNLDTFIGARFKMQETCNVIVVVKSGEQYYKTQQKVKVTLGGCGG